MKINFKIFLIAIAFVVLVSMACNVGIAPAPTPTSTEIPTQVPTSTPLPTYTPYPTYTLVPTVTQKVIIPPSPTAVPNVVSSGAAEVDCPSDLTIPSGMTTKCYIINVSPVAVGMIYYQGNTVAAITITWANTASKSVIDKAAAFAIEQATSAGWNISDFVDLTDKLANSPQDTNVSYGSLSGRWTNSGEFTILIYGISSFFKASY